jgi:formylglycine-generating enzyme required for sulfatase activity
MRKKKLSDSMPAGTKLLWYEIVKVLGKGGFGITYMARDPNLDQLVAIKEYLPTSIASRDENHAVQPNSPDDAKIFDWGLERFLQEGKILAQFKHTSIVHVLSLFKDNNTAYIVMEYEEGESLDDILKVKKTLPSHDIFRFLPPLLSGLEKLHKNNYIHRDIKPANILIRKNGTPVILDFGSSRQALVDSQEEMTSLLTMGYSPFEQYDTNSSRQGPWSDIYAMGGVLYRTISGYKPQDAATRVSARMRNEPDSMKTAVENGKGEYPQNFLKAVDQALMVVETDRPQSISEWRTMLFEGMTKKKKSTTYEQMQPLAASDTSTGEPSEEQPQKTASAGKKKKKKATNSWRSLITRLNDFGSATGLGKKSALSKSGVKKKGASENSKQATPEAQTSENSPKTSAPKFVNPKPLADRKAGDLWVEPLTNLHFIWIPHGEFQMGSPDEESGRRLDEGPVHKVVLDGFWISKYPVTWGQWKRVTMDTGKLFDPSLKDHPVERISFDDTQKFIRKLSQLLKLKKFLFRLPTEAEWEYAARAGTTGADYSKTDAIPTEGISPHLAEFCWFNNNSSGETQPVGMLKPNAWGVHDMLGNVWEWISDCYNKKYYAESPERNPRGAAYGDVRVRRGGCWRSTETACRLASRSQVTMGSKNNKLGMRLVMSDE